MDLSCVSHSLGKHELPPIHDCLLPLLSKLIGYTIIATSTVCKVPQIYLILKNKSIEGLSIPSFELEVIGFTISLAYCMFKQLAFSAYGELVFLVLQSVIQVGLMYYYSPSGISTWLKSGLYCAITPVLMAGHLDPMLFEALYASQHAIFLIAKIPQIKENFQNQSTGQLSFVTNFLNFGGVFGSSPAHYMTAFFISHVQITHPVIFDLSTAVRLYHLASLSLSLTHTHTHTHNTYMTMMVGYVARLFTSLQEKAPLSMIVGCLLGIITNSIIMWQFLIYRGSQPKKIKKVE